MPLNPLPLPIDTPLVEPNEQGQLLITFLWLQTFVARDQQLAASAQTVQAVDLLDQAASLAPTSINLGQSAGTFRINLYARITRAASVSSALTPTFRWTESGVSQSRTYSAVTGNTTQTILLDVFPVLIDAVSAFTYETTYASVGAPTMQYRLYIAAERIQ